MILPWVLGCVPTPVEPEEPTALQCPRPGWSPVELGWTVGSNESLGAVNQRVKHHAFDVLDGVRVDLEPGTDWEAIVAVSTQRTGFEAIPLVGEQVSLWRQDDGWVELGSDTSDASGRVQFGPQGGTGLEQATVVLHGDGSCTPMVSLDLPAGAPIVLTDIDGTLTVSDQELFRQIGDGTYDPEGFAGGPEMLAAWVEHGVQPVYMTARPHVLRNETRAWLDRHSYPRGPVITAPELVLGDATIAYKQAWVERIVDDAAWDIVAAYGNAPTDIEAYLEGGIPVERVYIIGEHAGEQGTVAVGPDWVEHTTDVVQAYVP